MAADDEEEIEIPNEDVPLMVADDEEEIEIPDEDVPLSDVPKTGDSSPLWYLSALLSACGLSALSLKKKKKD